MNTARYAIPTARRTAAGSVVSAGIAWATSARAVLAPPRGSASTAVRYRPVSGASTSRGGRTDVQSAGGLHGPRAASTVRGSP